MTLRLLVAAGLLAGSGAIFAQTTTPTTASDQWSRPAPASTVRYGDATPARPEDATSSHFKFKERRDAHPTRSDALNAAGKAPVMGGNELGRDGRPTVNCANTPMDPACR